MVGTYPGRPSASTGLGIIAGGITPSAAAAPDVRLTVPPPAASQATSWHQPSPHYSHDVSGPIRGTAWDLSSPYMHPSSAMGMPSGLPHSTPSHPNYTANMPPMQMSGHPAMPVGARFVPLQNYQDHSHQTSHA